MRWILVGKASHAVDLCGFPFSTSLRSTFMFWRPLRCFVFQSRKVRSAGQLITLWRSSVGCSNARGPLLHSLVQSSRSMVHSISEGCTSRANDNQRRHRQQRCEIRDLHSPTDRFASRCAPNAPSLAARCPKSGSNCRLYLGGIGVARYCSRTPDSHAAAMKTPWLYLRAAKRVRFKDAITGR